MNNIEEALKVLVENGYTITTPVDKIVYLVDYGSHCPMATRRTLQPKKGMYKKTAYQRVALIKLD